MARRSSAVRRGTKGPTFSWAPVVGRHETAVSYLSRLAVMNGRSIGDLRTETGIFARDIDLGMEPAVRRMATLCGMGVGRLAQWSPRRLPDRSWRLHGQDLGSEGPDRTFFRWCPTCVREDVAMHGEIGPYLRAEWQVPHIRSCDRHGIMLLAATPARRQFEPFHFAETIAALLPSIDRIVGETVSVPSSPFEGYLRRRLAGERRSAVWLDTMPFHAAAEFCGIVGAVANQGRKVRPTSLSAAQSHAAAEAGFSAIGSGPADLRTFLGGIHAGTRNGRGVWGARASIGHVHVFLERKIADEAYAPAIEAVRDFLLDTVPFDADDVLFGTPVGQRRIHTVRTASLQSGAHARTMRKVLVRTGHVDADDLAKHRDHHTTLDAQAVDRLLVDLQTALTTPKVIARTGIPRLHLSSMIHANQLVSLTRSNGVLWAKHKFSVRDVDALMERVFAGSQEVSDPLPGTCGIMEVRARAVCSVREVIALVLGGRLSWKGRLAGRHDYMALLLDPEEVRQLVRREEGTGLTMIAAAAFIGMSAKSVKKFADSGDLPTEIEINAVNRCPQTVVTRAGAEKFKTDYMSLFDAAARFEMHFLRAKTMLEEAGIRPAFDPVAFSTTFYDRRRVEAFGLSRIGPTTMRSCLSEERTVV